MKKLLTIVALALILCLGVSALVSANAANETYKAVLNPAVITGKSVVGGYPTASLEDIKNPANWEITDKDWIPMPDSAEASKLSNAILNLFISSAKAEYHAAVETVIVGAIVHGQPTVVTVIDVNDISANTLVMIDDNDHWEGWIEYDILEDGFCHSRWHCGDPDCDFCFDWSDKPQHNPWTLDYKFEDGVRVMYCTECGAEIKDFDGHDHDECKDEIWLVPQCTDSEIKYQYYWACTVCGAPLIKETINGKDHYVIADEIGPSILVTSDREAFLADNPYWAELADDDYYDEDCHLWGDWGVYKAADCMDGTTYARTCYWCNAQQTWADDDVKDIQYKPVYIACNDTDDFMLECRFCNGANGGDHRIWLNLADLTLDDFADYPADDDGTPAINLIHEYDFTQTPYVVPATCNNNGRSSWFCIHGDWENYSHFQWYGESENGLHSDTEGVWTEYTGDLGGHKWSDWTCVMEPDINVRGIWTRTCNFATSWWEEGVKVDYHCPATETHISFAAPCTDETHEFELNEDLSYDATCTEPGLKVYYCVNCGYEKEEEVEKLGHNPTWIAQVAATCTKAGVKIGKCDRCGAYLEEEVPVIDHAWGEWTVKTAATPTTKGIEERKCANCDATEEREVEFKPAETSVYTVSEFVYDKEAQEVTGKVTLDPTTAAQKVVKARVSFYLADKSWFAVVTDVKADGTFSVGTNVNAVYVKVNIMGENATHHIPDEKDVYGTGEAKIVGE